VAANHIRTLLLKSVCPVLKNCRNAADTIEDYKTDFGSMGEKKKIAIYYFNLINIYMYII
jgi:hypothetical protein